MTRIRLRTRPMALFGAFFVIALIVFLPMRLLLGWVGLGDQGLTARQVAGSMWWGTLHEVHAAGFDLGDLDAALAPAPLVVGRARIALSGDGAPGLNGALSVSRHAIGLDDVTAGIVGGAAFAPVPVSSLNLDDVSVRFKDGACDAAEGRVRLTLGGAIGGVPLPAAMAGTARCDGASLLLPLASTAGTERLDIRVRQGGGYTADLAIAAADPALGTKLQLAGFRPSANGYLLSIQGRL